MNVVVDIMEEIVGRVSDTLTPQLQKVDSMVNGVHFDYGYAQEIIQAIQNRSLSRSKRFSNYPLVGLIQPFRESESQVIGFDKEVNLDLFIVTGSKADIRTKERYKSKLKPVLYPIYKELVRQVGMDARIVGGGYSGTVRYVKEDHPYYPTANQNTLNDFLDAIIIRELRFNLYEISCLK